MARLIGPMTLVVRGALTVRPLGALIRTALREADGEQAISNLRTMSEVLVRSRAQRRLLLTIMTGLAVAALPNDMASFAGIAAVLAAGTTLASYRPAKRAAAMDPTAALRE